MQAAWYDKQGLAREVLQVGEMADPEPGPRLPACCDGRVVVSCGVNDTAMEDGRTRVDFDDSCVNSRAILEGGVYPSILVGPPPVPAPPADSAGRSGRAVDRS